MNNKPISTNNQEFHNIVTFQIRHLELTLQTRAVTNQDTVSEYAERMLEGDKFPPVVVFEVPKWKFLLVDGRHRVDAALKCGFAEIACDLHVGSRADALKFALKANAKNGLQRTNADKRRAVELALEEFGDMSNRALAVMCGVSDMFVGSVRQVQTDCTSDVHVGLDGKKYSATKPKVETLREVDKLGQRIPDRLIPLWEGNREVQDILSVISRIKCAIESAQDNKDLLYAEVNFTDTIARLKTAYDFTKVALGFAVCPDCGGKEQAEPCKLCVGRGLLSELRWDRCVPQKTKERIAAGVGGVQL